MNLRLANMDLRLARAICWLDRITGLQALTIAAARVVVEDRLAKADAAGKTSA